MTTLCNPGEAYITEDWTYPSAIASSAPHDIHPVGVPMDDQGMRSDELRKLLAGWDEATRGKKRYVFYIQMVVIWVRSTVSAITVPGWLPLSRLDERNLRDR